VLWHGGFRLRAWSAGGGLLSSGTCNRDARVPGRRQTGWAALSAAPSPRNMATRLGAGNCLRPMKQRRAFCGCAAPSAPSRAQQNCAPCSPGGPGMRRRSPPMPPTARERHRKSSRRRRSRALPSNCQSGESHLIRVQVTVRQSTATTHPDKSMLSLVFTVRVPE